jgi:predicted nucleic acid-binding protein
MSALVADASVVVKCLVPESGSLHAIKLMRGPVPPVAPEFVYAEVTNALWKNVRRGLVGPATVAHAVHALLGMSLETIALEALTSAAFDLAVAHNHPVYDCYYLAAAIQNDATLATAEERLYDLAQRVGLGERAILVR